MEKSLRSQREGSLLTSQFYLNSHILHSLFIRILGGSAHSNQDIHRKGDAERRKGKGVVRV
jgi:hypothetical protein